MQVLLLGQSESGEWLLRIHVAWANAEYRKVDDIEE